jgi:hypothetical protein
MSSNEQVHRSNRLPALLKMRSDVAIVGSGVFTERANFKRGQKFYQCLPILLRVAAFRSSVLKFTDCDGGNHKIRGTELPHHLDDLRRIIPNDIDTNVRIQHEEHHHFSLSSKGGWSLFPSI